MPRPQGQRFDSVPGASGAPRRRVPLLAGLALGLTLVSAGAPRGQEPARTGAGEVAAVDTAAAIAAVRSLGAELRALQARKGHWSGGEWDDDLDRWGGRLHQVLNQVQARVEATRAAWSVDRVVEALGPPARRFGRERGEGQLGPAWWDGTVRSPGCEEVLVYPWRGLHDFLFVECRGQEVLRVAWWMAGE